MSNRELIAEARKHWALEPGQEYPIGEQATILTLADALESTTEQLAAAEATIAAAVAVVDRDTDALANLDPVELRQILT